MKVLSDIQIQLKNIVSQIDILNKELESIKNSSYNGRSDYEKIELMAKSYPIQNRELELASYLTKSIYFRFLSSLAQINNSSLNEKMLFVFRIVLGSKYDNRLEYILKSGMDINQKIFEDIEKHIGELRYSLILDALIQSNISGNISTEEIEFISDTAKILNLTQEDMKVLSQLALSILQQDQKIFDKIICSPPNKWMGKFKHYIPTNWIIESRELHKDVGFSNIYYVFLRNYKYEINPKSIVVKDQDIRIDYYDGKEYKTKAKKSGIVYKKGVDYYVTSIFDDNLDNFFDNDKIL